MSKKIALELYQSASPLGYLDAQARELANAANPIPNETPKATKEVPAAGNIADPDRFVFTSPELHEDDRYEYDLTTGNAIDDIGDLLFDIFLKQFGDTAYNVKVNLHQHSVTERYHFTMGVDPELLGEEEMTEEERELAAFDASEAIEEIMMTMDEANSGDEKYDSLAGFDINHSKNQFSVPDKITMLEMIRNYAREIGIKFYNIHEFNCEPPQDVEKTPAQNYKAMMQRKASLLASCAGEEGFAESVSDCTLMRVYNSVTSYLGHAQMVLETVGPEDMEYSIRFAIIESKIYMEEPEKMGDWYKNAALSAVRPCLN